MTKILTNLYKTSNHYREKIFVILISAILLVSFSYVFLLQKAILNVIQRGKITQQINSSSIATSELEQKYFSLKNTITMEMAYAKGLKSAEVTSYITKKPLTAMALHNEI